MRRGNRRVALVMGCAACLAALACAPATRVKVLSFFFDGVPGAPGTEAGGIKLPESARLKPASPYHPERTPIPVPKALPIVSRHAPVEKGQCQECHNLGRGLQVMATDAKLCDKCHGEQRKREGWNHGPLNLGTCIPCHRAHESPYPHLLERPIPELCLTCHQDDQQVDKKHFTDPANQNCTRCHDPHRMY